MDYNATATAKLQIKQLHQVTKRGVKITAYEVKSNNTIKSMCVVQTNTRHFCTFQKSESAKCIQFINDEIGTVDLIMGMPLIGKEEGLPESEQHESLINRVFDQTFNKSFNQIQNHVIETNEKSTYSREDVEKIIIGLIIFSGSHNNQGLKPIFGDSYGDKAKHVLKCADLMDTETNTGIVTMVSKLRNDL